MENVGDLIQKHNLSAVEHRAFMGWSAVVSSRKLRNLRRWTYDDLDRTARWFRLQGVPIGPADLRYLVNLPENGGGDA